MRTTTINFMIISTLVLLIQGVEPKIVWKTKPDKQQIARENESVKLNCEFESKGADSPPAYFVIWYKDGASPLALNDQLANLNSTNYEINGKYNLIIKNLTRNDSGVYTCQLFQSNDMIASVNLTVLVPPKYAKISLKYNEEYDYVTTTKGYLVENEKINLECCTNDDANPQPLFKWYRLARNQANKQQQLIINEYNDEDDVILQKSDSINHKYIYYNSESKICNRLSLNLTRYDNDYVYKCTVGNEALINKKSLNDNLLLSVEYKPETLVHLGGNTAVVNKLKLIENSSVTLYCNSTALPNSISYEWYLNDALLREFRTDTLILSNIQKSQAGVYQCKSTNRHGSSRSYFTIELIYAQILPTNKTGSNNPESQNLRQPGVAYLSTYENASVTLTCEIDSNPSIDNVIWFYYQINKDNQIVNKVMLSNWVNTVSTVLNENVKRRYSQLILNNATLNHTGYYACSINFILNDDLSHAVNINSNATYFLQVQYTPIVKAVRSNIFANQYDQIELSCEVKSNPQSIFSWFYGNKELFSNYKFNVTNSVYKQIQRTYLDDLDNFHHYKSSLVINSITQFDYGDYYCRANNIIGESTQLIRLKRKQKPDAPTDLKIVETTANSVQLSWLSGSNGGENSTFIVTVNQTHNLTTFTEDYAEDVQESEKRFNIIEIKGLQPQQTYEFKVFAHNLLGYSESSQIVKTKTLKTSLKPDKLPVIQNAQFNEIREAICFDVEPSNEFLLKNYFSNQQLKDIVVKIDININDEVLSVGAQDLTRSNKTYSLVNKPKQTVTTSTFRSALDEPQKQQTKTYMISLSKLKYGQNCILYSQLVDLDSQIRNSSGIRHQHLLGQSSLSKKKRIYSLNPQPSSISASQISSSSSNLISSLFTTASLKPMPSAKVSYDINNAANFYDFKRLHKVNISLCYTNDSSICAEKVAVFDYNPDFSTYITLIAIGCSAILIFIVLLIASLCCCCCRRRTNSKAKQGLRKADLNSKLVIKSFPIIAAQQSNFDYSDSSTKSSQQHILNGSSGSHSSGSSSSSYLRAEKSYYHHEHAGVYDANMQSKYTTTYKMDYGIKNPPSVATVESDASSSASIENKTSSTSNGKSSSSHSPFTILPDTTTNYFMSSPYSNTSHRPQMNGISSHKKTLVYNSSNNMYIKTYQQPHQSQNGIKPIAQQQQSSDERAESGYSTPINNISKKLVYEVIV